MRKKIFFCTAQATVFLLILLSFVHSNTTNLIHHSKHKKTLAVELQYVFMNAHIPRFATKLTKLFFTSGHKKELTKVALSKSFWSDTVKSIRRFESVGEDIIHRLIETFPVLAEHEQEIQQLAVTTLWEPDPEMVLFLKAFKESNPDYMVVGVGNIGQHALSALHEQYRKDFALFDGFFIPARGLHQKLMHEDFFYKDLRSYIELVQKGNGNIILLMRSNHHYQDAVSRAHVDIDVIPYHSHTQLREDLTKRQLKAPEKEGYFGRFMRKIKGLWE